MIHASVELVEAMRGSLPHPNEKKNIPTACGMLEPSTIWAWLTGGPTDSREQDTESWSVTCPACLALMAEARGPERTAALAIRADELEARGDIAASSAIRSAVPVVPGVAKENER